MRRSFFHTILSIAVFYVLAALSARAISPDPRILSLVSPHVEILSGMRAFSSGGDTDCFLMITPNNKTDYEDFNALSGADSSRSVHEILFETAPGESGAMSAHSLLVSGRFDRERIYSSAVSNGATKSVYRGFDVLVVQPFLRERDVFNEVRWFAVIDGSLALFGTISSVEQELDRYLAHSSVDSMLAKKLGRLKQDAETWSMLLAFDGNHQTPNVLRSMEPTLPESIPLGATLEFRLRYGSHIEFEYDVSAPSEADVETTFHSLSLALPGSGARVSSFLPPASSRAGSPAHGTIKLSRDRYHAWLAEVSARGRDGSAASP